MECPQISQVKSSFQGVTCSKIRDMKVTTEGFLLLNSHGIDLFLKVVDQLVANGAADGTFEGCARYLQQEIHDYGARLDAWKVAPVSTALPKPLTMTMGVLLERRTCNNRQYCALRSNIVYIIRDGETVLYVGSTRYDARSRIKSHQKAHSLLGKALRTQAVDEWTVEMIPHADYKSASDKEKRLIVELSPRFNVK